VTVSNFILVLVNVAVLHCGCFNSRHV